MLTEDKALLYSGFIIIICIERHLELDKENEIVKTMKGRKYLLPTTRLRLSKPLQSRFRINLERQDHLPELFPAVLHSQNFKSVILHR